LDFVFNIYCIDFVFQVCKFLSVSLVIVKELSSRMLSILEQKEVQIPEPKFGDVLISSGVVKI